MSNIADITVYDGAATPVAHVLKAVSVSKDTKGRITALWREQLASVPVYAQVRAEIRLEQLPSGVFRTETKAVVPVMETVSGQNSAGYTAAPKVAYENTFSQVGHFSNRSDVAGRRLVRQLAVNLANGIYTTVTPSTSGPVPDLVDLLTAPT